MKKKKEIIKVTILKERKFRRRILRNKQEGENKMVEKWRKQMRKKKSKSKYVDRIRYIWSF